MLSSNTSPPVIFALAAPSALHSSCPSWDAQGQYSYSVFFSSFPFLQLFSLSERDLFNAMQ